MARFRCSPQITRPHSAFCPKTTKRHSAFLTNSFAFLEGMVGGLDRCGGLVAKMQAGPILHSASVTKTEDRQKSTTDLRTFCYSSSGLVPA